jgi:hypothetical protein
MTMCMCMHMSPFVFVGLCLLLVNMLVGCHMHLRSRGITKVCAIQLQPRG